MALAASSPFTDHCYNILMLKRESGFTLVELALTAAVVGLAVLAIGTAFTTIQQANRDARTQIIATQAAQQEMEIVRNTPYSALAVGTTDLSSNLSAYPLLPGPKSMQLAITQSAADLLQAEVTVSYQWHGGSRDLKLTTLVANNGENH